MLKKIIKTYYKLLDEKLENWTMVVLLIALLIISASLITNDANASLLAKNNLLETNITHQNQYSIIEIDWIKYKIIFEKIKN